VRPRNWVMIGVGALLIGGVAAGANHLRAWLPPGRSLPGTYVGGRMQPADEGLDAWLERRQRTLLAREAYLVLPDGEHLQTTFGDLGIELDTLTLATDVRQHATQGHLGARLMRAWRARQGDEDLPLRWTFHAETASETIRKVAALVEVAPVDARIDLVRHERIAAVPGRTLDLPATIASVGAGDRHELATFAVRVRETPPKVTLDQLLQVDVTQVLGAFETDFSNTGRGREVNVSVAARYLDGHVIQPGETISFNELVGPRTLERGFTWAPEIYDDELTPGIGGGVCQVASTMHAAALYGGFEVVRRRSHSRPSSYIKMGLDATVIYGEVDLKVRNPYQRSVLVHAFVPKSGLLRIELLGVPPPHQVEYRAGVVERHEFYRRVKTKSEMGARSKRKQRGNYGYDVVSQLRVERHDGSTYTRNYRSEYRPTPEVYWIGPEVSVESLPQLPEGAASVEVDGDEVAEAGAEPADRSRADG
jgi:vancomycin resistance protein YoaR